MENTEKPKFRTYKGFPLVRSGNEICYGDQNDEFYTRIVIQSTRRVKDLEVADKLRIHLLPTDMDAPLDLTQMKPPATRSNLYEALELANTWLVSRNQ